MIVYTQVIDNNFCMHRITYVYVFLYQSCEQRKYFKLSEYGISDASSGDPNQPLKKS